ncbi:ArsC family reductase [Alteromonas sp. ASW11-130]|uniref:ArsC family reductase n=1 Tax=Alteromonas sp. ASW11-130 TaxID=3015775 RepID=UPI0022419B18|nr:ArsC family reductase [Alteromonas sp. ASW11-130]MCW8090644.1 ArsC family reductase [Alteromonas sp. ASW11-130]
MTTLFGIPNCDTIKKAKKWLNEHQIEHEFHDYRKNGVTLDWLQSVEPQLGWEKMLNKRGTTFRQLNDEDKQNLDKDKALSLLAANPAMIKRPIVEHDGRYYIGFSNAQFEGIFNS